MDSFCDFRVLDFGFWVFGFGFEFGFWVLGFGFWVLEAPGGSRGPGGPLAAGANGGSERSGGFFAGTRRPRGLLQQTSSPSTKEPPKEPL